MTALPKLRRMALPIAVGLGVTRKEARSLKPDIDVEQKTGIYAFALNDWWTVLQTEEPSSLVVRAI